MKKYVVIKNGTVLGEYEDSNAAVLETLKVEDMGTFIIEEHCDSENDK